MRRVCRACRIADETFGTSSNRTGCNVGCGNESIDQVGPCVTQNNDMRVRPPHRKVLVELPTLLLLGPLESERLDFLRNTESCQRYTRESQPVHLGVQSPPRKEEARRTVDVEVVHAAEIGLRLASDVADTVRLATVAFLGDMAAERKHDATSARRVSTPRLQSRGCHGRATSSTHP